MNTILLDTNSVTFLRAGDTEIKKSIDKSSVVYVSTIVVGELYSGFYRGKKLEENKVFLRNFLREEKVELLTLTLKTGEYYGKLLSDLSKKGELIPANDIWVSAQALETDSTLITYDRHFLKIPGLKVWNQI